MTKLTITEAVRLIPVSESKLRRDMKAGVVSFEVDEKGKKRFDPSELRRVYGELALPHEPRQVSGSHHPPSETGHDSQKVITVLENQVADLQHQLELANTREEVLTAEKSKLLDITDRLQKQTEILMIPAEKQKSGFFTLLREKFLP